MPKKIAKRLSRRVPSATTKELSWLDFNGRVLEEAADPTVPLIERVKFLGIYSNNLDEFFRVRVATLNRLAKMPPKKSASLIDHDPKRTLRKVHRLVVTQQSRFDRTFASLLKELEKQQIHIVDERHLTPPQAQFVSEYFQREVRSKLFPIMLDRGDKFPDLKDRSAYLAVTLKKTGDKTHYYALMEIPTDLLPRFVLLPSTGKDTHIILLDDIIRFNLGSIFAPFGNARCTAHTIKVTRDAELDIDDDVFESYVRKVHKSLQQRKEGLPVRLVYDARIPHDLLKLIVHRLKLRKTDPAIAGSRYHNFKDFMKFPRVGPPAFRYPEASPIPHRDLIGRKSVLEAVSRRDILLHVPYQPFDSFIDLLREASIDPHVRSIKITLYRTAPTSSVVNALMNAVKNGKNVVAVVELQARFDEEANIRWATELRDAGAKVVFGVPGLKVHAKLCLITRRNGRGVERIVVAGTGNFNEVTAKVYTDHFLFTANPKVTEQVADVFEFLEKNYKVTPFRHLIVAPFNSRRRLTSLIETEIENASDGQKAWIFLKLNHLIDPQLINLLYKASQAGVKIRLIVRGMFTLQPGIPGLSDNIEAIRLVDKFLEHSRVLFFANNGNEKCFISSADWMPRNLDRRVEVAFPILEKNLKKELREIMELQWRDSVKATRYGSPGRSNGPAGSASRRAQMEIFNYIAKLNS